MPLQTFLTVHKSKDMQEQVIQITLEPLESNLDLKVFVRK